MAEGSMKTYQVEYLITMQDQASKALETLTINAGNFQGALEKVPTIVKQATKALQELRTEAKTSLVITPELSLNTIKGQFKILENEAKTVADSIARVMQKAMIGTSTKAFQDSSQTREGIAKQIKEKKALLKNKKLVGNAVDVAVLEKDIKELQELKKTAPRARSMSNSTIATYSSLAKEASKLNVAADAIKNINTNISQMARSQERVIKIDADISPAVTKINTLLETIRTNVAALPITVTEAGKAAAAGTKGGKAISPKTGKSTKAGSANIAAASKGSLSAVENVLKNQKGSSKAVVDIVPKTNPLVTQLTQSKERLQAKAKENPITLRSSFNGGDAAFQLNQSIAKLNELAKTKPVVIRSTFNGGDAAFQLRLSLGKLQELANTTPVVLNSAVSATNKGNTGATRGRSTRTASQMSVKEAQAELNASLSNARQLNRLKWLQATPQPLTTSSGSSSGGSVSRGSSPVRMARPTESLYARSRAFLYPFTGNTSFGARTPMAVDMAKGMGTMFAIGGAMSAVGSSLSQSVHYQNIMKTTQAILENGTKNYSDGGFKQMEQVVRQVGKETKFTAPQVASAAKFLAMAGYDIPSIKSAINPVANIALIGDTNLGETADKLTNVMTTFGIAPEKMNDIADIMTSTFTRSNTDMMMLAESAKYAGGIAHLYGGNFQNNFSDVMAMFGALGNAGIQASSAGTTLRMMYQNLMQPNKNQKKTLEHYGIKTRSSSGTPLEMVDILKQISEKVPKGQLADAVGNMFRITAQPGAAALVQAISKEPGQGGLIDLMEANRRAAGTGVAQSIADEKKNTLQGLWAQVESTFTEGVLQALENREGGWAGELMRLRDYLAKPETIQMLSSIVDMVEQLARTMAQFAKIYAKIYSMFPGLINGWMHVQLLFTQLGYLATPIIQLMSIMDRLRISMFGAAAATAAATTAENGKRAATTGGAAAGLLGGISRYGKYAQSEEALKNHALYQTGMAYWMGKSTSMKNIANRHGAKAMSMLKNISPGNYWAIAAVNPELAAAIGQGPYLGLEAYSKRYPKSAIAQEYIKAQHAAEKASLAGTKMKAVKAKYFEQLRAVRRPDQLMNRALIDRYERMGGDATVIAQAREQIAARDARVAQATAARHAARGTVGSDVRNRFAQRYGFKRGAKMTWGTSFSAGRAMGTLSLASMFSGLKSMALSLFSGLAKAIGLLVSPVGLAVAGIAALGGALYYVYNRIEKYHENLKLAEESSKWMDIANRGVYSNYIKTGIETGGFQPIEIGYAKNKEDESVISYKISNSVADTLADKDNVYGLTGSEILSKYASGFEFLPQSYINEYKKTHQDYDISSSYNPNAGQVTATRVINEKAVEDARKLGMIALWGEEASKQKDVVQAMKDLQEAMKNADAKRIQDILNAYAPTSKTYMANLKDAEAIQRIADPTKYREWQEVQYNVLNKLVKEQQSPFLHYKNAMDLIGKYNELTTNERKGYDVSQLGQTLIQSIPIAFNGTTASISLNKMGMIDWATLAKTVNNNIPFTVEQQQEILQNVYDAIYNDPNIKNCTSIIDLLKTYLPQIANQPSPYDEGGRFQTWGEANEETDNTNSEENSVGILARPKEGYELPKLDFSRPNLPQWKTDFDRTSGDGLMQKTTNYIQKYPERFPQTTSTVKNLTNTKKNVNASYSPTDDKKKQKDYASTYGRNAAKPTQVIINIDKLASFDRTSISKESNERTITEAIEAKIAEAVSMLSSQILTTTSAAISQGLS